MGKKKNQKARWDWLFWLIVIGIVVIISYAVYSSVSSPKQNSTITQQNNSSNQISKQPSNSDLSGVKMQVNGKDLQDSNGIKVNAGGKQDSTNN